MNVSTRPKRTGPARGFTLVELMVVVIIIGILMSLILLAAMDGVRRAEERATQGLISKLETGLDDRLQALLEQQPDYNHAHLYMATVYNGTTFIPNLLPGSTNTQQGLQRVNTIARFDYIKAELPDVFVYDSTNANYPLNFAAQPYVSGNTTLTDMNYVLPLGNSVLDDGPYGSASPGWSSFGAYTGGNQYGTGIYGASYTVAAGFYKNLGYLPAGYDGADNNPPNGLIDDVAESGMTLAAIQAKLAKHTHKTARAEALYALLVEGQGPMGSVFDADDFTDREVQDTDGDGLPEFVDAWGEPLQFYRWPVYYHSDLQRGVPVNNSFNANSSTVPPTVGNGTMNFPYLGVFDPREQNPIDPNQQLLAPSWWSRTYNTGVTANGTYTVTAYPSTLNASPLSPGAAAFSTFFHTLVEPLASSSISGSTPATSGLYWDRGVTYYPRRAFFSKFLIASSGPDRELGIARLDTFKISASPSSAAQRTTVVASVLIESQARQTNLGYTSDAFMAPTDANPKIPSTDRPLSEAGQDDITNHNFQAPGGISQ